MPTNVSWIEVAVRLALTAVAAGIIGFNRDEHGHSAGLRTNMLVALAACVAMIQTNLLINSAGKRSDSFVVMDTMRLPLGILSGIGFIGAGAIVKRGEMIVGVTTAATLWFVTVMGLCFGGGQLGLGIAAFALAFVILWGLRKLERAITPEQSATLTVDVASEGPDEPEMQKVLNRNGLRASTLSVHYEQPEVACKRFAWKVKWRAQREDTGPPKVVEELRQRSDVRTVEFRR